SAFSRRGIDGHGSLQAAHPLLHAEDAEAFFASVGEAGTIVLNRNENFRALVAHGNAHLGGVRVLAGIVQRFLNDAIDAGSVVVGQVVGGVFGVDADFDPGAA